MLQAKEFLGLGGVLTWDETSTLVKMSEILRRNKFFHFCFSWFHLWHKEVGGLGAESKLQLLTTATAIAAPDLSDICDLPYSLWQRQILNLSQARD